MQAGWLRILLPVAMTAVRLAAADVTGTVSIQRHAAAQKSKPDHSGAVVSLEPLPGAAPLTVTPGNFQVVQKNKHFVPHVLAIPIGSTVAFPNLDPFFHNVFSLFDGKRFDLGLYEAGASRSTTFTRPGVCFIFCNIHAEMSAVVVVMNTPYFAVTPASGRFTITGVAPGRYRLRVWHERAQPVQSLNAETDVPAAGLTVPTITLSDSGQLSVPHKNKYGHEYDPPRTDRIYK